MPNQQDINELLADMASDDTNPTVLIRRLGTRWRTAVINGKKPCQLMDGNKPFEPKDIDTLIERLDTAKASFEVRFIRRKAEFFNATGANA